LSYSKPFTVVSCLLLALITAVFIRSLSNGGTADFRPSLLEFLPAPDAGASVVIISALRGEFPREAARLFTDTSPARPGVSGMAAFMPILGSADAMALLIAEHDEELAACGVFVPALEEYDILNSGELPAGWKRYFPAAELRSAWGDGVFALNADNLPAPIYLAAENDLVFVAASMEGIEKIMAVDGGFAAGIRKKWTVEPRWGGHVYLSDGGLISEALNGAPDPPGHGKPLEIEAAWIASGDAGASRVKWAVSGAENLAGSVFLNNLRPGDWRNTDVFMPDPLVLSFGVNLPNPGVNMSFLPGPLKYAAEHMRKMGMRTSEIRDMLTGRVAFSLGGRTQLLWFELPGVVADIPGRGKASFSLIERFWSELFVGAEPNPVEGFGRGGVTNLPFTVFAAANDEKTVIGLVPPDSEQNFEAKSLAASVSSAIAWAYVDFPMLGAALAEVPALNSMIYEQDEEGPLDEEAADNLKNAMSSLGRIFITLESASSGSAICYY
jgi:hypothetical protein